MQRLIIFTVLVVLLAASRHSFSYEFTDKQEEKAQMLIEKALVDDTGYHLVESLTTEVGPRLAGSDAEQRAREWAMKKFKSLGFKNRRIEAFDVPKWQRGIELAEITSPYPQKLVVTALGGSVATPEDGIEGEVVMFSSLAELTEIKDNSLEGKIVYIDEIMARTQDGSGYGVAVKKRGQTAFEAHRVGAVAALIRSVGTSSHRFAHTGQMKRITDTTVGPSVPAAALSAPDADQLTRMLTNANSVRLRLTLTPKQMPQGRSGNVVAEIPGRESPEEIVLIGAHLDSWDLATGAVDDGAGVGIVMAAANLIVQNIKKRPRRTIRVVLFGAEEVGLVGAKSYTETHMESLSNHIFAAESDFGADVIWRFGTVNVTEEKLPVITAINKILAPLLIVPGDNRASGGPDLFYMKLAGVPIGDLRQNGRDYFDLHHTANDTFDKIDVEKLRQNIAAYAALTYLIADIEEDFR